MTLSEQSADTLGALTVALNRTIAADVEPYLVSGALVEAIATTVAYCLADVSAERPVKPTPRGFSAR
jgi:hypothetical protein